MSLLWLRPARAEQSYSPDERRLRDYLSAPGGVSESVDSLAHKLGVRRSCCRRMLEELAEQGVLRRREFADIQPIYYRYPGQ